MKSAYCNTIIALACSLFACGAHGQTFTNPSPITIRDNLPAQPYPSTITVSGVTGPVGTISVTLRNFTHSFVGDVVAGVRGPNGTFYPILVHCGTNSDAAGTYTFVPRGLAGPFTVTGGTYSTSQCVPNVPLPSLDWPLGDLGDLIGASDVNGAWSLYVSDEALADTGSISGGWSISFGPVGGVPAASPNAITYQGTLATPDAPVDHEVLAQFRLYDAASGGARVGVPLAMRVTPSNGLFTVPLDFGNTAPFSTGAPLWLEATVDGVPLLPRQRLTPTPYASYARNAGEAAYATNAGIANASTFATTAQSVPWTGITGMPGNVADLRVNPAALANSAIINGAIGVGAEPLASSRLLVHEPLLSTAQWHIELTNAAAPSFRGGIRLTDAGFVDVSNSAASQFGLFARLNNLGSWTAASDARLKTDVHAASGMLDAALKLRPVYFHWLHGDDANADQEDFGLIAQEAREVLPRLVMGDERKETLTLNYSQLSVVAIGAIQELKARHDAELQATRDFFAAQLAAQRAEMEQLKTDLTRRIEAIEAEQSR